MASELGRSLWDGSSNDPNNAHEELLVFGYSCKLFRDNEKALYIDNQKHLIPWMGDSSTGDKLMIDRYDVRGALYDLGEAEKVPKQVELTEEELAEEELCEQERYFALYHDEYQYQEYEEEQTKRLTAELGNDVYTYGQVGLNYDQQMLAQLPPPPPPLPEEENQVEQSYQPQEAVQSASHTNASEQQLGQDQETDGYFPLTDEDKFIPPKALNVPNGMTVPDTIKQNKIIIKTAKFIVAQGGQMEILIKTKQAGNHMFGFLSFDNHLNAYYKHMVAMMKNGRYRPTDEETREKVVDPNDGQYLHPSLSGIKPDLTPGTLLTGPHKPSADCAYSKLIHKIQEKQKNASEAASPRDSPAAWPANVAPSSTPNVPTSSKPEEEKKPECVDSTPIGKTVDTLKSRIKGGGLVDYPSFNATHDSSHTEDSDSDSSTEPARPRSKISRLLPDQPDLNSAGDTSYSNIKWPSPDVQMVIDKMASYIIKNGPEFEIMVRSRGDERFAFLNKKHKYNPYYRCKMRLYTEVYGDIFKEGGKDKSASGNNENNFKSSKKTHNKKAPATISFSIKPREQDVKVDARSTFPVESSTTDDEDMEEEERERRRVARDERRRKRKLKLLEERERREREEKEREREREKESEREREREIERKEKEMLEADKSDDSEGSDDGEAYDIFKFAQEMNEDGRSSSKPLSERGRERKKRGAGPSRDNKRQERRKKAAMFLSQLKKSGLGSDDEDSQMLPIGPQMPPELIAQLLNSASQSPRSSDGGTLPSSSEHSRSPSPHENLKNRQSTPPLPPLDPQPPEDAPAPPPPPPPPGDTPSPSSEEEGEISSHEQLGSEKATRSGAGDTSIGSELGDQLKSLSSKDSSFILGIVEDGSSLSSEICRSKARETESSHREKRSLKKRHRGRSSSRSPVSRRERKKRKRSRERSRRHKKGRSRSRSTEKSRSSRSHKKKHRKQRSSRHTDKESRDSRRSKKSRRHRSVSSSSSSSDSTEVSHSATISSSGSDDDVQIVETPPRPDVGSGSSSVRKRESRSPSLPKKTSASPSITKKSRSSRSPSQSKSKRSSRASSVLSIDTSDTRAMHRIPEESTAELQIGVEQYPPLPQGSQTKVVDSGQPLVDISGDDMVLRQSEKKPVGDHSEVQQPEKKPLFNPASSAAMAKIALGLRAKVHALLEKESKI